ncbi:hypothetical protein GW17_00054111, partial [Ensete ventricosum]
FLEQVSRTTSLEGESKEDRPGHTNYKFPISLTLVHLCRFEMPFNVWCGGCNSMIAKGVRFNAEKKQVGNYYSTKVLENFFYCIWSFTMKSACCKHEIVIHTDPKNCEYSQKRKVAEEEEVSRRMGLGIRLLPPTQEDAASAAGIRFASKFERNRKDKRAAIKASSIFPGSATRSRRLELESKRRKIKATAASAVLSGRIKAFVVATEGRRIR